MHRTYCAAEDCDGIVAMWEDHERPPRAKYCSLSCRPARATKKATVERRKSAGLRAHAQAQHGLSDPEWLAFMADPKCHACGTTDPGHKNGWNVDHDHLCCATSFGCPKCIRGILCSGCNMALGFLKDDFDRVLSLAAYIYRDQAVVVPSSHETLPVAPG